jgi:hypothetical protein
MHAERLNPDRVDTVWHMQKGANKASKSSKHSKKAKHEKGGDSSEPDVLTGNAITPGKGGAALQRQVLKWWA